MLKSRNKKFAPKVGGARRPAATPASIQSSAPPSVEPQSQTLPPTPSIDDVPPYISEKGPVPVEPEVTNVEKVGAAEPEPSHPIVEKDTATEAQPDGQPTAPSSPAKSKAQDAVASEPPPKRIPLPTSARIEQPIAEASRPQQTILNEPTRDGASVPQRVPVTPQPTPDSNLQKPTDNTTASRNPDSDSAQPAKVIPNAITELQPDVSRMEIDSEAQNYITPTETDVQDTDIEGDETGNSRESSPEDPLAPSQKSYPTPAGASGMSASPAPSMDVEDPMSVGAGRMGQGSRIISMAGLNPDGTPADASMDPADPASPGKGKAKRRYIMKRKKVHGQEDNDARATIDMQLSPPKRAKRRRKKGSRKENGGSSKRAPTPEGAEDEVVDPTVLKVSELCRDLRIGKKFSRHDEIKVQYEKSKQEARLARDNSVPQESAEEAQEAPDDDVAAAEEDAIPTNRPNGMKMRVVDGQIVIDQQSTQHDPHAAISRDAVEVVEENDFTNLITSNSFTKKMKTQKWDELSTELFYQGLAQFGTDFEMIKKMFPRRERKSIKLKFNKEEKINSARVNRVLRGEKRAIDLEWFQEKSHLKLEEVDVLNGQREEVEKEHQQRQEDFRREKAAADKEKEDQINAEAGGTTTSGNKDDDAAEPGNGKGKGKSGKKGKADTGRKKKNMHSSNLEETFEVLPSIERDY